ncbi:MULTISPECIES: hypothetical protein [unclassified Streptomyces]|uniref:hypothetical protein n=1 Tax=unclassified Streptomyces TaxID=2593676 RepID=UPI002DD8C83A|nr:MULTISPECIES: hypothetical protein [unclassified Streptomyces]WSC34451.1 hypothetical protein OHA08_02170 [Streptomyces sp. NBC_01763]WSC42865.1 hypothetical protein OIE61_02035 [Streptomyces sp. NBC_01762]WSJ55582.1 hypothetical protein OG243_42265 [Streptomyces sp. NBC_01318]
MPLPAANDGDAVYVAEPTRVADLVLQLPHHSLSVLSYEDGLAAPRCVRGDAFEVDHR